MRIKIFAIVLIFLPSIIFAQELTDPLKVIFSHPAGFYNQVFSLKLSVPNNIYDITYTLDGSNPQTSATAKKGGKSVSIAINPASTDSRPATPAFLVRASLSKSGFTPSKPETRTYIFVNNVVSQKNPGGGWPSTNVNGQWIDLAMDEKVTSNLLYSNSIIPSLQSIPSISIVTDIENLFDPTTGIYVNAEKHGEEWERFCSVELIDPKNSSNRFNINAGLRIRGGWSRHDNYPKHAFRLFFKSEYGAAKLKFSLFGEEGADEFDKIDLRCEQNYSWSNNQSRNTMVREVFSRDTQRDMGQPYTRSRYYHLYLNGMYWGLYQSQERAEARFAETYMGGSEEDYDVMKVNTEGFDYHVEASDGNLEAWERLWNLCQVGFTQSAVYYALEGKNAYGEPELGKEIFVDIDNLIDYMLVIFYTGNFDSPTTSFMGNRKPNNFYSIYKRDDKTKGFVFFCHDAEHSMMVDPVSPGIGINENRVEIPSMSVSGLTLFHPQWLHYKLTANDEYRQRFADRVYKHFYNNGALTMANCALRFNNRVKEVEPAVVAESARWGDAGSGFARTKDNDWKPEIDKVMQKFFPERGEIVLQQLIDADLFTDIPTPLVREGNTAIETEMRNVGYTFEINLFDNSKNGKIYYTIDGSDPRMVGGTINPKAFTVESGVPLVFSGSQLLKVRLKRNNVWSPLRTVKLISSYETANLLKVTEVHYNPLDSLVGADTISGKSFEFIEFKNIGTESVNLTGLKFINGIDYKFKDNELLPPGAFYVIASKPKWFFERYGMVASDGFDKSLSDEGEIIAIQDRNGNILQTFQYSFAEPWPVGTNGEGYTLCANGVYPLGDPNEPNYWTRSAFIGGSPFFDETGFPLVENKPSLSPKSVKVYPNPTTGFIYFKIEDNADEARIEIFSMNGQKVFLGTINQSSVIDLNQLKIPRGLLLAKITQDGRTKVEKIIYR